MTVESRSIYSGPVRRAFDGFDRQMRELQDRVYVLERGRITVDITGLTVTVSVAYGPASTTLRIDWGDGGGVEFLTLDGWGAGEASHTYAAPGTYHVQIIDPPSTVLREADITV